MNILVLGGSYFLGKHFVANAIGQHSVTVLNRGNRPLGLPQINEITGDRHDCQSFTAISGKHFDAIVDFCAYAKNDISFVFEQLRGCFDQYIFISTCDVYRHGLGEVLDESAPFETTGLGGETGEYISGKVELEKELVSCSLKNGVKYTSIRPAIIYGPDNYAPREGIYFNWIENAGQILHPTDSTGEFQMVYVQDVVRAILCAIGNEIAYDKAYNLTPFPVVTYDSFAAALEEAEDIKFLKIPVTTQTIIQKQIPLPFPLFREESNWYNGTGALQLIGEYTTLTKGLRNTIMWRRNRSEN